MPAGSFPGEKAHADGHPVVVPDQDILEGLCIAPGYAAAKGFKQLPAVCRLADQNDLVRIGQSGKRRRGSLAFQAAARPAAQPFPFHPVGDGSFRPLDGGANQKALVRADQAAEFCRIGDCVRLKNHTAQPEMIDFGVFAQLSKLRLPETVRDAEKHIVRQVWWQRR